MGCCFCGGVPEEDMRRMSLEEVVDEPTAFAYSNRNGMPSRKVLLTGGKSSGKSTVLKQMRMIKCGYDDLAIKQCLGRIRFDIFSEMRTYLNKCIRLYKSDPNNYFLFQIPINDEGDELKVDSNEQISFNTTMDHRKESIKNFNTAVQSLESVIKDETNDTQTIESKMEQLCEQCHTILENHISDKNQWRQQTIEFFDKIESESKLIGDNENALIFANALLNDYATIGNSLSSFERFNNAKTEDEQKTPDYTIETFDSMINDMKQSDESVNRQQHITKIRQWILSALTIIDVTNEGWNHLEMVGNWIQVLWQSIPAIKHFYNGRGVLHNILCLDNIDYFFDKSSEIFKRDYVATEQDFIRCRSSGDPFDVFTYEDSVNAFEIVDWDESARTTAEGKKAESNVAALMFVVDLNGYRYNCGDDASSDKSDNNVMQSSLKLFETLLDAHWFRRSVLILFLNKSDLFRQSLRDGFSLKLCFGDKWDTNDDWMNNRKPDSGEDDESFDECHMKAVEFIQSEFENRNSDPMQNIYKHVTCAIDTDYIKKVWWDCCCIMIKTNYRYNGLI